MAPKAAKTPAKPRKPKDPNAPKRPRGRPRKDGTLPRVKQEGKSPTSSYDSESDSDLEIEEPPDPMPEILKSGRPNDSDGQVLFDTVQAVWSPHNKPAVPDNIRAGIAQFGETIRKLRDAWKAKNAALQQAENANSSNVASLKEEVGQYRRLMQEVAKTAVELGHPAHLKKYVYTSPFFPFMARRMPPRSPWFAVENVSKYVQVEVKIWPIFQRLKNYHSKRPSTCFLTAVRQGQITAVQTQQYFIPRSSKIMAPLPPPFLFQMSSQTEQLIVNSKHFLAGELFSHLWCYFWTWPFNICTCWLPTMLYTSSTTKNFRINANSCPDLVKMSSRYLLSKQSSSIGSMPETITDP
jgi:hypothetical protein